MENVDGSGNGLTQVSNNIYPQDFEFVKMFLSNPWYDGFNGCLENLKISRDDKILFSSLQNLWELRLYKFLVCPSTFFGNNCTDLVYLPYLFHDLC